MKRRAFTLVELLTVIAIVSILYAVLTPVFLSARGMARQYVAGQAMMKLTTAAHMYATDNDETCVLGFYELSTGERQNWFGVVKQNGDVDSERGLFFPYLKGRIQPDAVLQARPWAGDETGYGYNWGYLGSDYYVKGGQSTPKYCVNPASMSMLAHPATTIEFGTSSFFFAPWLPDGDGQTYRYGFIDPPTTWFGNPTVDFRHGGTKTVDPTRRELKSSGVALIVFADGHLKAYKQGAIEDKQFIRDTIQGSPYDLIGAF